MERTITKTQLTMAIDKNLYEALEAEFSNKSKYVEWLIYQDMKKYSKNEKVKKLII